MKTQKLLLVLAVSLFISYAQVLQAQTIHRSIKVTFDDCVILCLNRAVEGVVYYDVSYHLNKATGKINSLRWNAHSMGLFDSETGEKFRYMDLGIDKLGGNWDFFNNPNIWNSGYPIFWDVQDGWLNSVMPSVLPSEGTFVGTYKLIGNQGTKVSWSVVTQYHINANGEMTVEILTNKIDCN